MLRAMSTACVAASLTWFAAGAEAMSCTNGPSCLHVDYMVSGNINDDDLGQFLNFTGTATLEYQAAGPNDVQAGPVHLVGLSESAVVNFSSPGIARLTGTAQINAAASQSGSLFFPGGGQPNGALLLGTLIGQSVGFIHCFEFTPGFCAFAELTNSTRVTFNTMVATIFNLVGTAGNQITAGLFNAQHTLTFANVTADGTITTVFTEVTRTFIPEPATGSLVALGLVGLGAAGSWRSRRRVSARDPS